MKPLLVHNFYRRPRGGDAALAQAMAEALDDPSPPDVRLRAADFTVDRAMDCYLQVLGVTAE